MNTTEGMLIRQKENTEDVFEIISASFQYEFVLVREVDKPICRMYIIAKSDIEKNWEAAS